MPVRTLYRLLALLLVAMLPVSKPVGAQEACATAEWSPPVPIWRMVNDSFAMHPYDVVVTPNHIVALGEYVDLEPPRKNWEIGYLMGVAYDRRTGSTVPIRKPNLHMRYEGLRGALDRDGYLQLLWGETAGVTVSDTTGGLGGRQIWSASWKDGVLSTPTFVAGGVGLGWAEGGVPTIQTDGAGALHIVVPEGSPRSPGVFLHLHRSGRTWAADTVITSSVRQSFYANLAVRDTSLHVIFISPDSRTAADVNSVWYINSHDHGAHWSTAVRIQQSAQLPAFEPQLVIAPDGELRAFWGQSYAGHNSFMRAVRPALSRDDGRTWTIGQDYEVANGLRLIKNALTNACGTSTLHLITDPDGTYGLASSLGWRNGRWEAESPFTDPDLFVGRSILSNSSNGELVRVWSSAVNRPGVPFVLTWYESHARVVMPNDRRP